jgi:hypothetical protein
VRESRAFRRAAALVVLAVLCASHASAEGEPPPAANGRVVQYVDDLLTVRLEKMPVSDVLDELGRQAGAEIRGQVREPRDVTAEFEAVPLPEALHRLLGSQNFALIYADGGRLRAVKLLGGPLATPPPAPGQAPPPTVPAVAPTPMSPAAFVGLLERHAPLPITGRLAEVLGADTATFTQLVDAGLHNDDPVVRLEAVRVTIQAIEAEPELRAGVIGTMNSLDIGEAATLMRGAAGERAEELAMHLATQSRATELRAKASSLLQQLRRPRPGS